MKARLYTLLFALLPRRWQWKLWSWLANKHGYRGELTAFRNGTYSFMGTPKIEEDLHAWREYEADNIEAIDKDAKALLGDAKPIPGSGKAFVTDDLDFS